MLFQNLLPKNYFLSSIFFISLTGIFIGLSILISKPYFPVYESKNNLEVVLALDTSISMNTQDILPSRIEVVKTGVENFLSSLPNSDIGIVIFAGKSYISLPTTNDISILKNYIKNLKTFNENNQNLQGTAIGDAILSSMKMFGDGKKAIILVTDGASNKGLSQKIAYEYAISSGVDVFMIGVGSKQGGYLTVGDSVQKIDGIDLKNFEGKKFEVQSIEDFDIAMKNIFSNYQNEQKLVIEKKYLDHKNILFVSVLLLLFVHLITQSKFSKD